MVRSTLSTVFRGRSAGTTRKFTFDANFLDLMMFCIGLVTKAIETLKDLTEYFLLSFSDDGIYVKTNDSYTWILPVEE